MKCLQCGKRLPAGVRSNRRYCNHSCRQMAYRLRSALPPMLAALERRDIHKCCPVCGRWFTVSSRSALRLYDSDSCQRKAARIRRAARAGGENAQV